MEGFFDETTCLCALNRVFGYVPQAGLALYRHVGSAAGVFGLAPAELRRLLGSYGNYAVHLGRDALPQAARELAETDVLGARFLPICDGAYPPLLLECPDPPLGLYFRGTSPPEEVFDGRKAIAIVGTRKVTSYGREWCRRLVRTLAETGEKPLIVSGLAYGVDGIAHIAALDYGLPTAGIMATGIDDIYPWQHRDLASRIAGTPGCALLTDYPLRTSPVAINFIRRNRIIAGLCSATLVIETACKGGSLITARYANEYSRDVFALPGRIDDGRSSGCNRLIQDRMADIIADPESLAERLGLGRPRTRNREDFLTALRRYYGDSLPPEKLETVLETAATIRDRRDLTVEEIAGRNGRPYQAVAEAAALLEADGFIEADLLRRYSIPAK
jgi:DNA processing protein